MFDHPIHRTINHMIDGAAVAAVIGTLMDKLPQATAVITFIWAVFRLYEAPTTRRILAWAHRRLQALAGLLDGRKMQ